MRAQRVLILSDQPLFAQGVRELVESHLHTPIIAIQACDKNSLSQIRELQPDVIILGDKSDSTNTFVAALLDLVSDARIIRLSMEDNVAHVYQGQQVTVQCKQDLIDVLDSLTDSPVAGINDIDKKEVPD